MPSAIYSRALIASLPHVPVERPHFAPNYGSDLGVRSSSDPREYFAGTVERMGICAVIDLTATIRDVSQGWVEETLTDTQLAAHMDSLISFIGSWHSAAELGRHVLDSNRPVLSHRALTYIASAQSSIGSDEAGRLFQLAGETPDATLPDKAMAGVRRAAWLIKRRGDLVAGGVQLAETIRKISEWADDFLISEADRSVLSAVCLNLRALNLARSQDLKSALETLRHGNELIRADGLVTVGEDARRRYAAQISVNIAQVYCKSDMVPAAVALMAEHGEWVRANHVGSVSEALAIYGYALYLNEDYSLAETVLAESTALIAEEGAPSRLMTARKIRAVCLDRIGRSKECADLIRAIEADPLGIDGFPWGDS